MKGLAGETTRKGLDRLRIYQCISPHEDNYTSVPKLESSETLAQPKPVFRTEVDMYRGMDGVGKGRRAKRTSHFAFSKSRLRSNSTHVYILYSNSTLKAFIPDLVRLFGEKY